MPLFTAVERRRAEALTQLVQTNPFSPEWVSQERKILGEAFKPAPRVYGRQVYWREGYLHPNVFAIGERVQELAETGLRRLLAGERPNDGELLLYEHLALYQLYRGPYVPLTDLARLTPQAAQAYPLAELWKAFRQAFQAGFPRQFQFPSAYRAEHIFAIFYQMRRAFVQIYDHIIGGSRPAARLRAAVWESIFTHDLHRFHHRLYQRMFDFPTLITGPSGTGKELVARAIGRSQYVPFDVRSAAFTARFDRLYFALNLSALAPTLIESELFGHCRGAFSGAVKDREGWLEQCDPHGAVFLDEIGEVDPAVQVKLLRVLQTREFERLGETTPRRFAGKLIAATNRDLAAGIQSGHMRSDFFFRLCADQIATPTLREQLQDAPDDLANLVLFVAREILGDPATEEASAEAQELTRAVVAWIDEHLGRDYAWPGNFRELGHCVRGLMIRRDYRPPGLAAATSGDLARDLAVQVAAGTLTAAELDKRYCQLVHAQAGSYQAAARRLGVDWRTVKTKVEAVE